MKAAAELRALRRKWVEGAPPTSHNAAVEAQLVISDLISECFALREELRQERTGGADLFAVYNRLSVKVRRNCENQKG